MGAPRVLAGLRASRPVSGGDRRCVALDLAPFSPGDPSPGQASPLSRTLIKICGVTRIEDVALITGLDVDVIGLNFVPASPRCIAADVAKLLRRSAGSRVEVWALFVNASAEEVRRIIGIVEPDVLQFNGDETPEFCRQFGRPWVKAVHMRPGVDVAEVAARCRDARMLLLDTWVAGQAGGTGQRFDVSLWPESCPIPLMLAGGLGPDNVADAVRQLRPAAVDVASGVEGAEKGLKDPERCRQFVDAVRSVDQQLERGTR